MLKDCPRKGKCLTHFHYSLLKDDAVPPAASNFAMPIMGSLCTVRVSKQWHLICCACAPTKLPHHALDAFGQLCRSLQTLPRCWALSCVCGNLPRYSHALEWRCCKVLWTYLYLKHHLRTSSSEDFYLVTTLVSSCERSGLEQTKDPQKQSLASIKTSL